MRESRIQQLVRLAAEKYALSIEWKGEDYGARKRYYRDAFLAGYAHAQSELAKARAQLKYKIDSIERDSAVNIPERCKNEVISTLKAAIKELQAEVETL